MVLVLTKDKEHALIAMGQLTHRPIGVIGQNRIIYLDNTLKDKYDISVVFSFALFSLQTYKALHEGLLIDLWSCSSVVLMD